MLRLKVVFFSVVLAIIFGALSSTSSWADGEKTVVFESCSPYMYACEIGTIDSEIKDMMSLWESVYKKQGQWMAERHANSVFTFVKKIDREKEYRNWEVLFLFHRKQVCLRRILTYTDHIHLPEGGLTVLPALP